MASIESLEEQQTQHDQQAEQLDQQVGLEFNIARELEDAGVDALALGRVMETREGIGENIPASSGDDDQNGSDHGTAGRTAAEVEAYRQKLLALEPPQKDMVSEIRKVLHQKLTELDKQEARLKRAGLKNIEQYNDIVAKIRHVNRLLNEMAQAGYKALKALWLRIVHGIV